MRTLRIAVLGMGYVGLTSSVAFAKHGYKTICTTTTSSKATKLNDRTPPFFEPDLERLW